MPKLPSPYDLQGMHEFMKRPDLRLVLMELELEELKAKLLKAKARPKRKKKGREKDA